MAKTAAVPQQQSQVILAVYSGKYLYCNITGSIICYYCMSLISVSINQTELYITFTYVRLAILQRSAQLRYIFLHILF